MKYKKNKKTLVRNLLNNKNLYNIDYFNYWYHNIYDKEKTKSFKQEYVIEYFVYLSKGLTCDTIKTLMRLNEDLYHMNDIVLTNWIKRELL